MTLTIQDLGALGELLGSVAVLVTLIYLAFQTRQNTLAITAQLDAARIAAVQRLNLVAATSTGLQEALNGDRVEPLKIEQAQLQQRRGLVGERGAELHSRLRRVGRGATLEGGVRGSLWCRLVPGGAPDAAPAGTST